jgi:glycosyltransferase involved in cell wall biosynthesis
MRIAFTLMGNSRRHNYINGENIRYNKGGASGTDCSVVAIAEYLAKCGYEVVIAVDPLNEEYLNNQIKNNNHWIPGNKNRGVYYTDFEFTNISNKNFDILVNTLWFEKYHSLPITVNKALIYWCHMQWIYGIDGMINYVKKHNLKLVFVHISAWERLMNSDCVNGSKNLYNNIESVLIPNPIYDDIIIETYKDMPIRNPKRFIFHANWIRGGDVCYNVFNKLDIENKELHFFDYFLAIHDYHADNVYKHGSVDKKTLFRELAKSEYFIYPLATIHNDIHKDTFSCVIAEAIAMGVTPVTYPLGAVGDNFKNFCMWVDYPKGIDEKKINSTPLSKDIDDHFKNNIDNFVKAIDFLEKNPSLKNFIKENGKKYIIDNFNIDKIGNKWNTLIKNIK